MIKISVRTDTFNYDVKSDSIPQMRINFMLGLLRITLPSMWFEILRTEENKNYSVIISCDLFGIPTTLSRCVPIGPFDLIDFIRDRIGIENYDDETKRKIDLLHDAPPVATSFFSRMVRKFNPDVLLVYAHISIDALNEYKSPTGYGKESMVVRDHGEVVGIWFHSDNTISYPNKRVAVFYYNGSR